jgi:hypothetical protein
LLNGGDQAFPLSCGFAEYVSNYSLPTCDKLMPKSWLWKVDGNVGLIHWTV